MRILGKAALAFLLALTFCGALAIVGWSAANDSAQKDAEQNQGAPAGPPVIRVQTRLVEVSVVVHNKKGEPVADLGRGDFTLFDQGKEQAISVFSVETSHALPRPAEPLPLHVYSNRIEHRAGLPTSVSVVLLDALNTRFEDQAYAREQVKKFLLQLRPEDRVAIYLLTGRSIRILHNFTNDSARLLKALQRDRGAISPALDASEPLEPDTGNAILDEVFRTGEQRIQNLALRIRVSETASAMEAIANHLSRFPGRKNLIWVSAAFPISFGEQALPSRSNLFPERGNFAEDVERAARAVSNANIAVYPVDARGLIGAFMTNTIPASGAPRTNRGDTTFSNLNSLGTNFDSMQLIAQRTGGRAFYNRNDIDAAIRSAIDDARVTYVLGYYPNHGKWDGKFHDIKVKVNRSGVQVRNRTGYYAANEQPADKGERERLLRDAATSPLEAATLGLIVRAEPTPDTDTPALNLAIQMDAKEISLRQQEGRWVGMVDFLFAPFAADGRALEGEIQTLNINLTPEHYEWIQQHGWTMRRDFATKPEMAELKIVVRDASTGATGSVTVPITAATAAKPAPH